jgi:tetratricopeptide (TPR) repeat protein
MQHTPLHYVVEKEFSTVSSINKSGCRCTIASCIAISLLVGCQTSGKFSNPLAHSDNGKPTWTSRISKNLKPFNKSEKVDPIDQELALARSLELQGKTAEAIYTYSTILAKEARAEAHHRLAILHDKAGNFKASEEHYKEALELDSKNADLLCDRGYSFMLQGNLEESQSYLDKAIKRDPELGRAHSGNG